MTRSIARRRSRRFRRRIFRGFLAAVAVYLAIAGGLAWLGAPGARQGEVTSFGDFGRLAALDYTGLPHLLRYPAGDGTQLAYRHYPAESERALILLHGSAYHGKQLHPLARMIADSGAAEVYVPDIRGHGASALPRGDVDHTGRLVEDLIDLIEHIRDARPDVRVFVGGHSSGGGLAVRLFGAGHGLDIAGGILLAPYLGHDAPTTRPASGGWARAYVPRIIGLSMLNMVGIDWLNGLTAIDFAMPASVRDGTETLSYSYRLMIAYAPRDYRTDLAGAPTDLLVLVGARDDAFLADKYAALIPPPSGARVEVLPDLTHLAIAYAPVTARHITEWLAAR